MAIDFGLGLLFGPEAGDINGWLNDLDKSLPALEEHFRSLWMTDHFFWEGQPTYEAWTTISYLAARFPAYEVAPMVLGQSYRNPGMLALMGATLQAISNGRLIMGIGAGWKEDEYRAFDYDYPRAGIRLEQLEDTLNIFKKMWSEPGQITYEGKHYTVRDAWCEPKPDPMIPILVGGGGKKTMRLAAKYADMWNLSDANIQDFTDRLDILKAHCDDIGRDIGTLRLTWFGRMAIGATQADAETRANSREIKYSTDDAFVGTPEQIAEQLQAFIDVGVDYFMVDVIGLPDEEVISLVTDRLMPMVKG
ncbi:MAG: LLM class flavin-dependent oxidoreductase [Aggregatilineales bacterium]